MLLIAAFTIFSVSAMAQQKSTNKNNQQKTSYYCPMKCEGDKTYAKAGKCPKCKMNLKEEKKATAAKAYYCPMKCEGDKTYAEAGKCPVCKMNLKEKSDDHSGHKH